MSEQLVIRCDSSASLGMGHLMRCLVLANAWPEKVVFAMKRHALAPERVLEAGHRITWVDDDDPRRLASQGACWVVVDHYQLDVPYLEALSDAGLRTLAIDDVASHAFPVDVLVNQNVDANLLAYSTRPETVRLLGPRYALVGDAYRRARPPRPGGRPLETIAITFGGSDPEDRTAATLESLAPLTDRLRLVAVVGAGYAGHARPSDGIVVERNLPDLIDVMLDAQLVIGAGGSTVWEACCLGVPMLLQPFVDNQRGIARGLAAVGAARDGTGLDGASLRDAIMSLRTEDLARMAEVAWNLVDGCGPARIVESMR
jgi:UDP-2,4-diacetamido-2,4,6-trideoxy-beta-L-altropyranose hydrolase